MLKPAPVWKLTCFSLVCALPFGHRDEFVMKIEAIVKHVRVMEPVPQSVRTAKRRKKAAADAAEKRAQHKKQRRIDAAFAPVASTDTAASRGVVHRSLGERARRSKLAASSWQSQYPFLHATLEHQGVAYFCAPCTLMRGTLNCSSTGPWITKVCEADEGRPAGAGLMWSARCVLTHACLSFTGD